MLSEGLKELYDGYYSDGGVAAKRTITATQTFGHIEKTYGDLNSTNILDVGSGDGAVIAEIANRTTNSEFTAVDISTSGVDAIKSRNIPGLIDATLFDGYTIPYDDNSYDLGLAVHVVEHVEHERMFIQELARVSKYCYIEVPLELTVRVNRAIKISGKHGHINFYTPDTFRNLLETSGLGIKGFSVFPHDKQFEQFIAGKMKGSIKYYLRSNALRYFRRPATDIFVYMCGAVVYKKDN